MRGADEPEFLYLTTTGRRSGRPCEIEIWFTGHDGRYYVIAERREQARWVRNLVADPRVRVRVGALVLSGRGRLVDARAEPELIDAARRRSEQKYGWGDGLVVELIPDGDPEPR